MFQTRSERRVGSVRLLIRRHRKPQVGTLLLRLQLREEVDGKVAEEVDGGILCCRCSPIDEEQETKKLLRLIPFFQLAQDHEQSATAAAVVLELLTAIMTAA